jgi:hypothetical protein
MEIKDQKPRAGDTLAWLLVAAMAAALVAFNLSVAVPVGLAIGKDDRNSGLVLTAYRTLGVHPQNITLDLWRVEDSAPADIYRATFQAAAALKDRSFGSVTFARSGKTAFRMSGEDFRDVGTAFASGENPLFLMRTFPEKLRTSTGESAYGSWSGGWLGVLVQQMEDVNAFANDWAAGGSR